MAYKGPDISAWQGDIDIKALAPQVDFFIFRAYAGMSKDKKVDRNVNLCIEANKPYGLYIYSYALNVTQAIEEANRVVALANTYKVKPNFLVIDMEDADGYKRRYGMPSNQTLKDICTEECEVFENAGYYAMIYASASWFNNQLAGLNSYDKWIARWTTRNGKQTGDATSPDGENANNCGLWQFTSEGTLRGYNGRLDMNYGYKDFIVKGFKTENVPAPTPKPTKSNEEVAEEVRKGLWGDGEDRIKRLTDAGYDAKAVQDLVNEYYDYYEIKEPTYTYYTVKPNDNLSKIGAEFNVDWKDIASINGITGPKYIIYIEQVLKIPKKNDIIEPRYKTYVVQLGDTLSGIGAKFNVRWKVIAEYNNISAPKYIIYPGQVLKIPN